MTIFCDRYDNDIFYADADINAFDDILHIKYRSIMVKNTARTVGGSTETKQCHKEMTFIGCVYG